MRIMKILSVVAILGILGISSANAQAVPVVTRNINISWVNPTTQTDNSPIPATGDSSLKSIIGFISTSPIPDSIGTPTFTLTPAGTSTSQPISFPAGSTVQVRLAACNVANICSVLSKNITITLPGVPNSPSNITVTVTVVVAP